MSQLVETHRIDRLLRECVDQFHLDLTGLVVFTEAASGHYLYTPLLAALAGADKTYAIAADSPFGKKEEIRRETMEVAERLRVAKTIEVIFEKTRPAIAASDIITNSGFVRPIDRRIITWMKRTAVIPLMWETWEFRDGEVDLEACREREILVLGTDESPPPHAMYPYGGYIGMKLLFELGLEGYKTSTLLLGGGEGLGRSIHDHFKRLGMQVDWFSAEEGSIPYDQLPEHFSRNGARYDAIIVAEHADPTCLLGDSGLLRYEDLKAKNPAMRIGVISGNVDRQGLQTSGIEFFPRNLRPFRYMSYQASNLGPLPVLELYAAGLKVGEAMARARLSGANVKESARYALEHSPAMDLLGDRAWL